ncbi:Hypothetical predicted protein [Mytilus galloprovincialis]|uniref:Uncharacterized protein n=1 Tax=Mytilus galloprovincialis TaxID=29158 RepID=A0A8B6C7U2_MYTGA|nr:Hypothetical predicted protein [Mytilus galloprovincialis]
MEEFSENFSKNLDFIDLTPSTKMKTIPTWKHLTKSKHSEQIIFANTCSQGPDVTHAQADNFQNELYQDAYAQLNFIRKFNTVEELCIEIQRKDLLLHVQYICRKILSDILPDIEDGCVDEDTSNKISLWNTLILIPINYKVYCAALSHCCDTQIEKVFAIKHRQKQKTRHRPVPRLRQNMDASYIRVSEKYVQLKDMQIAVNMVNKRSSAIQVVAFISNSLDTVNPVQNKLMADNPSSRIYTYSDWPVRTHVWPQQLSNAGFFYTREGTIVKCATCGVTTAVDNWQSHERPEIVHFKLNRNCEFIKGNFSHLNDTHKQTGIEEQKYAWRGTHVENHGNNISQNNAHNLNLDERNGRDNYERVVENSIESDNKRTRLRTYVDSDSGRDTQPRNFTSNKINNSTAGGDNFLAQAVSNPTQETAEQAAKSSLNEFGSLRTNTKQLTQQSEATLTNIVQNKDGYKNILNHNSTDDTIQYQYNANSHMPKGSRHDIPFNNALTNNYTIPCMDNASSMQEHAPKISSNNYGTYRPSSCSVPLNSVISGNNYSRSVDIDLPTNSLQSEQEQYEPEFSHPQFKTILQRISSYTNWPIDAKQAPTVLAESGCFYTGKNDIVRCFCCNLGLAEWAGTDNPWTEHARHNPKCWFLRREKGQRFIDSIQEEWKKRYKPKNPAFDDVLSRLATFDGWREDIEQTPEDLADAGFFSTGEDDIVRCHYCDGGLRNWESGDIPWEEHARWFPHCKYLIKMKGTGYIDSIKEKYQRQEASVNTTHSFEGQGDSSFLNNEHVKTLLRMGFTINNVKSAINRFIRTRGHSDFNTEDLLEFILDPTEPTQSTHVQSSEASSQQPRPFPTERGV